MINRIGIFGIVLLTLIGCDKNPTPPKPGNNSAATATRPLVRMGTVPSAYYLPLFVVQEKGLLAKRGYDSKVEVFAKNTDMMDAFLNGDVEVAAQSSGTLFPLEAKHPNQFRLIYGQNNRSYSFVVRADSEIKGLKDLKGKIVATWPSPTATLCIKLCVKPHFDPKDITIQPVEFKLLNQVLLQGDADAAFSPDVFAQQGISTGKIRFLRKHPLTEEVMDPFFSGGGFVSPKLIEKDPQLAQAIQDACEEAILFIRDNNREARLLMKKYVPAAEKDLLLAELDQFIPVRDVNIENAEKLANIFVDEGLMSKSIDVRTLFYNLRDAGPESKAGK